MNGEVAKKFNINDLEEGAVIANSIGGNALTGGKGKETVADQRSACREACHLIADIHCQDHPQVIVHGNGPQAGFIALRTFLALSKLHDVPMDAIVADTQGAIGYMIEQELMNILAQRGHPQARRVATLVTQVLVAHDDPAFEDFTKPIGPWMDESQAQDLATAVPDWVIKNVDPRSDEGWRRVVASPAPTGIVNLDAIRHSVHGGFPTISCGGGGIPVIEENGQLVGVPAVIDKDRATAHVAEGVGAEGMIIFTKAPGVIDLDEYAREGENGTPIDVLTTNEARALIPHLGRGDMGPKLGSCIQLTESTGKPSVIANFANGRDALQGKGGTHIVFSKGHA